MTVITTSDAVRTRLNAHIVSARRYALRQHYVPDLRELSELIIRNAYDNVRNTLVSGGDPSSVPINRFTFSVGTDMHHVLSKSLVGVVETFGLVAVDRQVQRSKPFDNLVLTGYDADAELVTQYLEVLYTQLNHSLSWWWNHRTDERNAEPGESYRRKRRWLQEQVQEHNSYVDSARRLVLRTVHSDETKRVMTQRLDLLRGKTVAADADPANDRNDAAVVA